MLAFRSWRVASWSQGGYSHSSSPRTGRLHWPAEKRKTSSWRSSIRQKNPSQNLPTCPPLGLLSKRNGIRMDLDQWFSSFNITWGLTGIPNNLCPHCAFCVELGPLLGVWAALSVLLLRNGFGRGEKVTTVEKPGTYYLSQVTGINIRCPVESRYPECDVMRMVLLKRQQPQPYHEKSIRPT